MPEVSQCIPQLLVSYTSSVCSLKSQKAQSQGIQEVTSSCRGINLQREPHCTAVLYLFRTFCKKMVHLLVWQRTGVPWLHRVGVPICQRAGVPAGRGQVSQMSEDRCPLAAEDRYPSSQRTGVQLSEDRCPCPQLAQTPPGALPPVPSGGTPGSRCTFLPLLLSPEGTAKEQKDQGLVLLHFKDEMQLEKNLL